MRLNRELVASREAFVVETVKANPDITGDAINKLLFARDGKRMAPNRLYELKNNTLAALKSELEVITSPSEPVLAKVAPQTETVQEVAQVEVVQAEIAPQVPEILGVAEISQPCFESSNFSF